MKENLKTDDLRTNKLLELFNFGNDEKFIFKGIDWEEVYNLELNEFDNLRLFRFFLDIYSNSYTDTAYLNHQKEKTKCFKVMLNHEDTKLFTIKDYAMKNFLKKLKKPKQIKEELKLPFNNLFLDTDIKIDNKLRIFGILGRFLPKLDLQKVNEVSEKEIKQKVINSNSNLLGLVYLYSTKNDDGEVFFDFADCLYDLETGKYLNRPKLKFNDGKDDLTDFKIINLMQKEITNFITNVLLFFNEPRVVTYVFNRPQKNRIKKGLIPIPSELRTKIHLDLKNFIETIYFSGKSHSKIGFAFWVIGHYRIFRSDYFKNKKGQKVWIPAHIRGEGLMPPQIFEVTK